MPEILMTLLVFALVGFVAYLLVTYVPMPDPFRQVFVVACVVLLVLWLISMLTGYTNFPALRPIR